jgi:hypothetical protein
MLGLVDIMGELVPLWAMLCLVGITRKLSAFVGDVEFGGDRARIGAFVCDVVFGWILRELVLCGGMLCFGGDHHHDRIWCFWAMLSLLEIG